jgi:hypothetical protein
LRNERLVDCIVQPIFWRHRELNPNANAIVVLLSHRPRVGTSDGVMRRLMRRVCDCSVP